VRWAITRAAQLGLAGLTLGACVLGGAGRPADPNAYVIEIRTDRTPAELQDCLKSVQVGGGDPRAPWPTTGVEQTTIYGAGSVSNFVSWSTRSEGDSTVLVVTAASWLFPSDGRGHQNTNRIIIPASTDARARAQNLTAACTGS
jgi:hypothetical protein